MPARFRDIVRALKELGLEVKEPDGSSHWRIVGADGKTYTIPSHNGLKAEISDIYIRGVCRAFGLDLADFKNRL